MDRQMLIHTLGVVARARGMMKLSKDSGITRAGVVAEILENRRGSAP
jgi:DNA-binding phage protein